MKPNLVWPSLVFALLLAFPRHGLSQACGLDEGFAVGLGGGSYVPAVTMQTNGQMLIGGAFFLGSPSRINLARLNHDGGLDNTFDPGTAVDIGVVSSIAVQPDGRIVVGGSFFSSTGIATSYLTRLNANGTVDGDFHFSFVDGPVNVVAAQPDGKILIAGNFVVVNGVVRRSVARLNSDGTLDAGFDACVAGSPDGANAMVLLKDGRILVGGYFTFSTGVFRNGVARLNTNGDVDPSFAPEPGVNFGSGVYAIAVCTNGSIIAGGSFSTYHDAPCQGIVQITGDNGSIDPGFNPGTGIDAGATVFALALCRNGQLLAGGNFSSFNSAARPGFARLNPNGSLDAACEGGLNAGARVSTLTVMEDSKVMAGGLFSVFGTAIHSGLVRVKGGPAPFHLSPPQRLAGGQFQMSFFGEAQSQYSVQVSSNLTQWMSFTNFTASSSAMLVTDPETNAWPMRFYRGTLLP